MNQQMKATKIEFKLRVWIITGLYILGFLAPWQYLSATLKGPRTWSRVALQLFATHWLSSQQAFIGVLIAAIAVAIAGAVLRLAGTAYIGAGTMQASTIQTDKIVAAGPYRFLRNPLYLGAWLTAVAVSLLMPYTGALFFIAALAIFEFRLIGAEEAHLTEQGGEAYLAYRQRVGRFFPRIRRPSAALSPRTAFGVYKSPSTESSVAPQGRKARWLQSLAAEVYSLGVAISLCTLGWTYDAPLLIRAVIVCFGLSLVAKAFVGPAY
jgi:protein-S-isoprenylcysteine O-methyltransferase Ste14